MRHAGGFGEENNCYRHGMHGTKFYNTWLGIKKRVNAKKDKRPKDYENYVVRGIKLCDRWQDFLKFKEDLYSSYLEAAEIYGEKNISIDRCNNDKGYEIGNIRWVTAKVQNINKRDNHYIELNGVTKTLVEWCEYYNVSFQVVSDRIGKLGWNIKDALETDTKELELYEYKGKKYTCAELSKEFNIDARTLYGRLHTSNWSVVKSVETPVTSFDRNIEITLGGQTKSLVEFCKEYKINYSTFLSRLDNGMSYEEALKSPVKTEMTATIDDKTQTIKDWCKELNVNYGTVLTRIKHGMSHEDALLSPKGTPLPIPKKRK